MAQLPYFQTDHPIVNQIETKWMGILNPILALPIVSGQLIQANLIVGVNQVSHKLQRIPQGWMIADINGVAQIYRSQAFDENYITLTSNAAVQVSLWVF